MRVKTETEKIVAVLHDVVEDSQPPQRWGLDELRREGFSEPVLSAREGVTRREGETCEEFIRRSQTSTRPQSRAQVLNGNQSIHPLSSRHDDHAARRPGFAPP